MTPPDPEVARAAQAGASERRSMVARLLAAGFVKDPRLSEALLTVPRHLFVPHVLAGEAYGDHALPIGHGQTCTQVAGVARAIELAALSPQARVLEIGTGTGYQAAVLSRVARSVYTLERIPDLAAIAQQLFGALGLANVTVKVFDGTYGWSAHAPYDAILVAAAAPEVPDPLLAQLSPCGRLVVPVGDSARQRLLVVRKLPNGRTRTEDGGDAAYVPLVGRFGFEEARPARAGR